MAKRPFLNTYINNLTLDEAVERIGEMAEKGVPTYVVEANADVIVKAESDAGLKAAIDGSGFTLADGKPLIWVSKWYGRPLKERVAGSDLVPALCGYAEKHGLSIYLIGGKKDVLEKAVKNIKKKHPSLFIAGHYSPPFGFEKDGKELEKINTKIRDARPDLLFAFFGCPKQEKWIYGNYKKYGVPVSVCAGGTVDFLAGTVKRAPKWMQDHGLEWFYRFLMEPRRLFKRYFIDDAKFWHIAYKYRRRAKS